MEAKVGDRLVVESAKVATPRREGEILEVHGQAGAPPYVVRWSDGHEGLTYPGPGCARRPGIDESSDSHSAREADVAFSDDLGRVTWVENQRRQQPSARAQQSLDSNAHWEQGVVGLSATALALRQLEYDGWTVLHDVRRPGRRQSNVDHVVIGNGQVYVINTEIWTGSVTVTGGVLRQNGRARQKAVTGVAEMAKSIASFAPMLPPSTVHPVLCFVREDWVSERFGDVLVCSTRTSSPPCATSSRRSADRRTCTTT